MSILETRVTRLEKRDGSHGNPFAHLSDEELEAQIAELEERLVASIEAGEPIPVEPAVWGKILERVATRGHHLVEINQGKSV